MDRESLSIFARELEKKHRIDSVRYFGSRQSGFSEQHGRPPIDTSDWDIAIITDRPVSEKKITKILKNLKLDNEPIDITQVACRRFYDGPKNYESSSFDEMLVRAIANGEKL